jgi:hypothetical protein
MQPTLDVRRHADGSIDFDFYRRRAMRRQRLARRTFVRRCLAAGPGIGKASAAVIANPMILSGRRSRSRLLVRAGAVAALLIVVAAVQAWVVPPLRCMLTAGNKVTQGG